ncbi:unnamed protein product, partial [Adineta ricciae]
IPAQFSPIPASSGGKENGRKTNLTGRDRPCHNNLGHTPYSPINMPHHPHRRLRQRHPSRLESTRPQENSYIGLIPVLNSMSITNANDSIESTRPWKNKPTGTDKHKPNFSGAKVIMARSFPVGSSNVGFSHFPTVSCKLRAENGHELIGYFL